MSRELGALIEAAIADPLVRPVLAYEGEWASGFVRVWTGQGDRTIGGNTYAGIGDLAGVSEIVETTETRSEGVTVTLSGIPPANVSIALGQARHGLPGTIYFGTIDASDVLTVTPLFSGRMGPVAFGPDGPENSTITVQYISRLADMRKASGRRYTAEDLEAEYPGDLGLQFVTRSVEGSPQFGGGWRWPS